MVRNVYRNKLLPSLHVVHPAHLKHIINLSEHRLGFEAALRCNQVKETMSPAFINGYISGLIQRVHNLLRDANLG